MSLKNEELDKTKTININLEKLRSDNENFIKNLELEIQNLKDENHKVIIDIYFK